MSNGAGLIGGLPVVFTYNVGPLVRVSDVLALLRSDETRANLAHVAYTYAAITPAEADEIVDAVLRVLTGDPTDSEAAK